MEHLYENKNTKEVLSQDEMNKFVLDGGKGNFIVIYDKKTAPKTIRKRHLPGRTGRSQENAGLAI